MTQGEKIGLHNLHDSYQYKPQDLLITNLNWRLLVRAVLKGKNVMLTGHSGCGKTKAVVTVATLLGRPFYKLNLGSTQDPRASIIGNTFFEEGKGTFFQPSNFVKAMSTPNTIILLDEYSRAHTEAINILLTVLDADQRYLRLDESNTDDLIKVASGVSFIATANIGNEYVGAKEMDRASKDRFSYIEMDLLTQSEEENLISLHFPALEPFMVSLLAKISFQVKADYLKENSEITNMMSTRMVLETADLLNDGFTLPEALQSTLLPFFSNMNGAASERAYVKKIIDGLIPKSKMSNAAKKSVTPGNMFLPTK